MKKIIFICFYIIALQSTAQINYSPKIPREQLSVLKQLESDLKKTPFTLSKIISDKATKISDADSAKYATIFKLFFDTAQIKNLKESQTNYMKKEEEDKWLKGMTSNGVIAMHNLLRCVPDSVFFVMPANEYNLIDKEDERVRYAAAQLLVAGYKGGGFYYPALSLLFSQDKQKIIYINFLINFDGDTKLKKEYFENFLKNIIAPCVRTFSEDYGKNQGDLLLKFPSDTLRVDDKHINN